MAQGIISTALEILSDWPSSFIEGLEHRLRELDPLARQHPEAFLAPIWRYLEREVAEEEGAFLFAAYDRFVRDAWKSRNYATYRQKSIRQMELF